MSGEELKWRGEGTSMTSYKLFFTRPTFRENYSVKLISITMREEFRLIELIAKVCTKVPPHPLWWSPSFLLALSSCS